MQRLCTVFGCGVLLVMVTLSALMVVWSTNDVRALTNQLLELRTEENQMRVAHGQYLLQESSISSAANLELIAAEKLALRYPENADIRVLLP